ncbi:MAG: hypothetical protein KDD60_10095, partial [Bdellovibrionales bacterium]|nr:hypothetical protein [Bdellovibrionales bacterium]
MLSDQLSQTIAQRLVQAAISQPNPGGQIEFHDGGRGDTIVQIAQNFATTINSPTAETLTSDQQVDCLTTNYLGCLRQNIGEDPLAQHTIEL